MALINGEQGNIRKVVEALKECGYDRESRRAYIEGYNRRNKVAKMRGPLALLTACAAGCYENPLLFVSGASILVGLNAYTRISYIREEEINELLEIARANKHYKRTGCLPFDLESKHLGLDLV